MEALAPFPRMRFIEQKGVPVAGTDLLAEKSCGKERKKPALSNSADFTEGSEAVAETDLELRCSPVGLAERIVGRHELA